MRHEIQNILEENKNQWDAEIHYEVHKNSKIQNTLQATRSNVDSVFKSNVNN